LDDCEGRYGPAGITRLIAFTYNFIEQKPEQCEGEREDCDQDYAAKNASSGLRAH
jgi:hypothetical protein